MQIGPLGYDWQIADDAPPAVPTLSIPAYNEGTSVLATVTNFTAGTVNSIYIKTPTGPWVLAGVADAGGLLTITPIDPGTYYGRVVSANAGGSQIGSTDPVFFQVVAIGTKTAQYRVVEILRNPAGATKTLIVERIEKPIHP